MTEVRIRPEAPADVAAIYGVHAAAFSTDAEARLVDRLRADGHLAHSLVAEIEGHIVGHVALSPVTIADRPADALGLGPVGVLPAHQRRGLGAALVTAALHAADGRLVVLLGDPRYYHRFGFEPASRQGLSDEYGGGDAFQAHGPAPFPGRVRYAPAFADLEA